MKDEDHTKTFQLPVSESCSHNARRSEHNSLGMKDKVLISPVFAPVSGNGLSHTAQGVAQNQPSAKIATRLFASKGQGSSFCVSGYGRNDVTIARITNSPKGCRRELSCQKGGREGIWGPKSSSLRINASKIATSSTNETSCKDSKAEREVPERQWRGACGLWRCGSSCWILHTPWHLRIEERVQRWQGQQALEEGEGH